MIAYRPAKNVSKMIPYSQDVPNREEIDQLAGSAVLEFGANWCSICKAAQPVIVAALQSHPQLRHIKAEDASKRPLGRSFGIKLWPTLIFLKDGTEVARVVRPTTPDLIREALARIS